MADQAHSIENK